jgi:hypothetical protein
VRARTSTHQQGPRRSASSFQLPPSRARAVNQIVAAVPRIEAIEGSASRFGPNPSSPKAKEELIVAVTCQESTRAQGVTLKAERTETKSARCRGALRHAWSSVSRAFVQSRREETKKGAFVQDPPEQEDKSSPFPSMELKFELDTRLTVSCVVAVASAYGLLTVSIALDSILLAFGNAVILLLILFVLFGWRELLEFNKKRSTAN